MVNRYITNYQENANQSHNEISPHTYLNGYHKKKIIITNVGKDMEEKEPLYMVGSVQFSSVAQSCLTLCDHMNLSTPGLPVHHQLPKSTQTHVH